MALQLIGSKEKKDLVHRSFAVSMERHERFNLAKKIALLKVSSKLFGCHWFPAWEKQKDLDLQACFCEHGATRTLQPCKENRFA
jgi:hypothetical protein